MIRRVALLLAMVMLTGCGYNSIQSMDEAAAASETLIEVQLQRRADLIPNLVDVVKGYAAHEDSIFTKVAEARSKLGGAIQSGDLEKMAAANSEMTGALSRLIAIAEAYPDLKANKNFQSLQDELAGTENRIARARTDYTEQAQAYNAYIRRFPIVITAKLTGAKPRKYFAVTSEQMKEAPKVKMGGGS